MTGACSLRLGMRICGTAIGSRRFRGVVPEATFPGSLIFYQRGRE